METQTRPPPLTTARLNISLLRANCCGGILSTSHHKRLDTGLAEDTWTDLCLWSQLNTSLLCPSWKNMLPPSLIVSVYIFYSLSLLLCPTSLPPSLSLSRLSSPSRALFLGAVVSRPCWKEKWNLWLTCFDAPHPHRRLPGPTTSTSCPWRRLWRTWHQMCRVF